MDLFNYAWLCYQILWLCYDDVSGCNNKFGMRAMVQGLVLKNTHKNGLN